jgi:hypothetical protein
MVRPSYSRVMLDPALAGTRVGDGINTVSMHRGGEVQCA